MDVATILLSVDASIVRLRFKPPERLNSFAIKMYEDVAVALTTIEVSGVATSVRSDYESG